MLYMSRSSSTSSVGFASALMWDASVLVSVGGILGSWDMLRGLCGIRGQRWCGITWLVWYIVVGGRWYKVVGVV